MSQQAGIDVSEGPAKVKAALRRQCETECGDQDTWRMQYLGKLVSLRGEHHYNGDEEGVCKLTPLIVSLCIS